MSDSAYDSSPRAVGRYVLYDALASGGMATVHFGRLSGPIGFSRVVAIKRLHPHLAREPDFVTMFLDEARLTARIRHPNVVQTLDVVRADDEILIVMEYAHGESLSRLSKMALQREVAIPLHIATAIVSGVLQGLHAAHEARDEQGAPLHLVHRDVSPQNIMVGVHGVPRVLDFGVAKAAGRLQTTREGQLKGKVAYMAPEHLGGAEITRKSDIYSAAVVLWELLTGKRLFEGGSEAAVLAKVLNARVEAPSAVNPNVSPALDAVVLKGLAVDLAQRYDTAREMALDLEKHGGLVSPSELGAWVEALAGDELSRRAQRAEAIERDTSDPIDAQAKDILSSLQAREEVATTASRPSRGGINAPWVPSEGGETQFSVAGQSGSSRHDERRGRRRKRVVAAVIVGCAALAVPAAIFFATRAVSNRTHAVAQPPAPAVTGIAPASETPIEGPRVETVEAPRVEPVLAPTTQAEAPRPDMRPQAPGTASTTGTKPTPPAVGAHPPRPTTTGTKVTPPRPAAAKDDCDPPYTWDADGHKIYKRNCL